VLAGAAVGLILLFDTLFLRWIHHPSHTTGIMLFEIFEKDLCTAAWRTEWEQENHESQYKYESTFQ